MHANTDPPIQVNSIGEYAAGTGSVEGDNTNLGSISCGLAMRLFNNPSDLTDIRSCSFEVTLEHMASLIPIYKTKTKIIPMKQNSHISIY